MSWQPTEEWPDERSAGGAFRGAAEVILARREPPTATETIRLWWHSTPDHPFSAIARRVVLTSGWLYVETRSGGRRRAPIDAVRGSRREAGRVIYAVADGDDLVIVDRGGDAIERALDEAVGVTGEWRQGTAGGVGCVVFLGLLVIAASIGVLWKYADEGVTELGLGMWTSEAALGLYAGVGGVLLMLLFALFFPAHVVADSVGLTIVRGVFGWVQSTKPVERVSTVSVRTEVHRSRRIRYDHHRVFVVFQNPPEEEDVHLAVAPSGHEDSRKKREVALQLGRRLARLYDVPLEDRGGQAPS